MYPNIILDRLTEEKTLFVIPDFLINKKLYYIIIVGFHRFDSLCFLYLLNLQKYTD